MKEDLERVIGPDEEGEVGPVRSYHGLIMIYLLYCNTHGVGNLKSISSIDVGNEKMLCRYCLADLPCLFLPFSAASASTDDPEATASSCLFFLSNIFH